MSKSFSSLFPSSRFTFNLLYIQVIFVWCEVGVQFYSFACRYPIFLTPFTEEIFLFPMHTLGSLVKLLADSILWVCSCVLDSVHLVMCLFLCQYPTFWLLSLYCILWNHKMWWLQLYSFSGFLWLFEVFYGSMLILGSFVLFF